MCGQWKQITSALLLCLLSALAINAQDKTTNPVPKITGYTVTLVDGYSFQVDEVWKQGEETWYRKGGMARRIQEPVKSIKPIAEQPKAQATEAAKPVAPVNTAATTSKSAPAKETWIHLVD